MTPRAARNVALSFLLSGVGLGLAPAAFADTPTPEHPRLPLDVTAPPPPTLGPLAAPTSAAAAAPRSTSTRTTATPASPSTSPASTPEMRRDDASGEAAGSPERAPEPRVEHLVSEDASIRIEEDRVRSQTTRIVVKSKIPGMGSYQIAPTDLSKDPSTDTRAGKRIWWQLDF
jgi:hypothetical protein